MISIFLTILRSIGFYPVSMFLGSRAPKPKPMIDQQQPQIKLDPDDPKAKAPIVKLTDLFE